MDSLEVWLPLVVKVITCGSCQKSFLPKVAIVHCEEEKKKQEGDKKKKTVRGIIFITNLSVGLDSLWDSQ